MLNGDGDSPRMRDAAHWPETHQMLATILSFQPTLAVVFAALLAAMILGVLGRTKPASLCILACLLLAVWQFLFEIYDPKEGFRMPWLQAELHIQLGRMA